MKKKVLITGSNGMLGYTLVDNIVSKNIYDVVAVSRGENINLNKKLYKYYSVDISNKQDFKEILDLEKPNYIINTAAVTNVDLCEKEEELCYNINTYSLEVLVDYCKNNNSFLVHISTDFVFDGKKEDDYNEDDIPNPLSIYGKSKLLSEQIIQKSSISYSILRTSQVYGFIKNFPRTNLITWLINNLKDNKSINVFNDQYRMPTYVGDLADMSIFCFENNKKGIYNICGKEYNSILEIAYKVADYFNFNKELINSVKTEDVNLLAPRPLKTKMSLKKSIKELNYNPKTIKEGLKIYEEFII